ncbi:MAG: hypothetical protein KF756_06115 [Acidobacteria bacterium]|nr:hypothetical protein [Acidobacteriota bacterium]
MRELTFTKRLKAYFSSEDTRNFSVLDFVGTFGSPLIALAYAKLFWPDFVEFKGMIFVGDNFDRETKDRIDAILHSSEAEREDFSGIEKSFNFFEVPSYFFGRHAGDTNEEEDRYLAEKLAEMWKCKLSMDFPERSFVIKLIEPEESGGEIALMFYQDEGYR